MNSKWMIQTVLNYLEVTDTEINIASYSEDGQDNDDETPKFFYKIIFISWGAQESISPFLGPPNFIDDTVNNLKLK